MNFVESLEIFHVAAKEIPCLTGKGAPTAQTEGAPGVLYMDTVTGGLYKCRGGSKNEYRWELQSGGFSEDDKAEIVGTVLDALSGKVIPGYVDEENNIVISCLPAGSYTVRYEMEDGGTIDIGALAVSGGAPAYTNLAEPDPGNTTDFEIWCNDARITSDGSVASRAGYACTNYFAVAPEDIIRIRGFKIERLGFYDADKNLLPYGAAPLSDLAGNYYIYGDYYQTDEAATFTMRAATPAYARLSGWVNTTLDAVIITNNEEID